MIFNTYKLHTKYVRGFSLVEVLVYMAVFVVVAGAMVTTFLSFDTVFLRNRTERVLTHEARASLEYISRAIKQADSINAGLSAFDTSPGALALIDGATTTRLYVSGGVLMLSVNGSDVGPLTSDAVTIEDITFNHQSGTVSDFVRVGLTLSTSNKAASTTKTFYTSGVLRGSYE
jgi:Tfp pilus assembly protein PilW